MAVPIGDTGVNVLAGHTGNDTLYGGTSSGSYVYGGDGNDYLDDRHGINDKVYGGNGDDVMVLYNRDETFDGGAGNDYFDVSFHDASGGTSGSNIVNLTTGAFNGSYAEGSWGAGTITSFISVEGIYGGAANETLTGNTATNYLYGAAGVDTIDGGSANDYLYGGSDNDIIYSGSGADKMYGGDGNDSLYGTDTTHHDTYYGGNGNDYMRDAAGRFGTMYGGEGNDTFYLMDAQLDKFYGGNGIDYLDLSDQGQGPYNNYNQVNLTTNYMRTSGGTYSYANATATVSSIEGAFGSTIADRLTGNTANNHFLGNAGNDNIWGVSGINTLDGGANNDLTYGGTGVDSIYGGSENDTIYSGTGVDLINGDGGNDVIYMNNDELNNNLQLGVNYANHWDPVNIYGGAGHDTLDLNQISTGSKVNFTSNFLTDIEVFIGTEGDDYLDGNNNGDTFYAASGNDSLYGDGGNDMLYGGTGFDSFWGGDGNDVIVETDDGNFYSATYGTYLVTGSMFGGTGVDTLDLSGRSSGIAISTNNSADIGLSLAVITTIT